MGAPVEERAEHDRALEQDEERDRLERGRDRIDAGRDGHADDEEVAHAAVLAQLVRRDDPEPGQGDEEHRQLEDDRHGEEDVHAEAEVRLGLEDVVERFDVEVGQELEGGGSTTK